MAAIPTLVNDPPDNQISVSHRENAKPGSDGSVERPPPTTTGKPRTRAQKKRVKFDQRDTATRTRQRAREETSRVGEKRANTTIQELPPQKQRKVTKRSAQERSRIVKTAKKTPKVRNSKPNVNKQATPKRTRLTTHLLKTPKPMEISTPATSTRQSRSGRPIITPALFKV